MSGKHNITIKQGSDFFLPIAIRVNGTLVDLTGCTIRGSVKQRYTDENPAATFVVTSSDLPNGRFTLAIPNAVTSTLSFDAGVYDVEVEYPSEVVDRILEGRAVVTKEVTRNV